MQELITLPSIDQGIADLIKLNEKVLADLARYQDIQIIQELRRELNNS